MEDRQRCKHELKYNPGRDTVSCPKCGKMWGNVTTPQEVEPFWYYIGTTAWPSDLIFRREGENENGN